MPETSIRWQFGRWSLQITPQEREKYVTSEYADVAGAPSGKPLDRGGEKNLLNYEYMLSVEFWVKLHTFVQ